MSSPLKVVIISLFLVTLAIGIYNIGQISLLNQQLGSLGNSIRTLSQSQASTSQKLAVAQQEIIRVQNQPSVMPQSQDQLLTAAVAKVAPAVVSVVISEDVPNLQVTRFRISNTRLSAERDDSAKGRRRKWLSYFPGWIYPDQ